MNVGACLRHHARHERADDCGDRRAPADARPRARPSPDAGTRPRAAGQPRAGHHRHWMPRTRTRSCAAPTTRRPSRRARRGPRPNAPMRRLRQRDGAIPPSASPTPSFRNPGAGIRTKPARSASTTAATAAHRPTHDRGQDRRRMPAPGRAPLASLVPDFVGTGCREHEPGPARRQRQDRRLAAPGNARLRLRRRNRSKPGASRVPDGRLPVTKLRGLRDACVTFLHVVRGEHGFPVYCAISPPCTPCVLRDSPMYYAKSPSVLRRFPMYYARFARQTVTGEAPPMISRNPALRPGSRARPVPGAAAHAPLGLDH